MQIFEVFELTEYPYMELKEIHNMKTAEGIVSEEFANRVFLLVDHDMTRIWTHNGQKSSLKLQFYGGILANELSKQLELFYRVYPLNSYSKDDSTYQELLNKPLSTGIAKEITPDDFPRLPPISSNIHAISLHLGVDPGDAEEYLKDLPPLNGYEKKLTIIGGNIYVDEPESKTFLEKAEIQKVITKQSVLNNGFMFFSDRNYSIRLVLKDRKLLGMELYVKSDQDDKHLELNIPIVKEEHFKSFNSIEKVLDSLNNEDSS